MVSLVITLLALLGAALAAPAPIPDDAVAAEFNAPAPFDFISLSAAGKTVAANSLTSNTMVKRNIGGVRMADGAGFTGHVWYGIYPLNTCIDLRSYAGNLLSFRPDEGTECLVMQGRCNGNDEFADLFYNSTNIGNLGEYFWIGTVNSYICLEES